MHSARAGQVFSLNDILEKQHRKHHSTLTTGLREHWTCFFFFFFPVSSLKARWPSSLWFLTAYLKIQQERHYGLPFLVCGFGKRYLFLVWDPLPMADQLQHHRVFTALSILCVMPDYLPLPLNHTSGIHWCFYCFQSFTFSRMSYACHHFICSLFRLAAFT